MSENSIEIYYHSYLPEISVLKYFDNQSEYHFKKIPSIEKNYFKELKPNNIFIFEVRNIEELDGILPDISHLTQSNFILVSLPTFTSSTRLNLLKSGIFGVIHEGDSESFTEILLQYKNAIYINSINSHSGFFTKVLQDRKVLNSEEKFKLISENISDMVTLHSPNENFLYISPASFSLLGYYPIEMISFSPYDISHPEDHSKLEKFYSSILDYSNVENILEYRLITKKKKTIWVETSVNIYENYENVIFLSTTRNIMDRKLAQQEILNSLHKEREVNELKSLFITTVSHEFRTPITNINMAAEMLERYLERMDTETRMKYLKDIKFSCIRMTNLMEEVLFIGKSEANKLEFNPKIIDLKPFCNAILHELEGYTENITKRIQFEYKVPPWVISIFDMNLMRHILINLLTNALKYSTETILFEVNYENENFIFIITDKGIGIPEDELESIFNPFHRAKNSSDFSGTGLGLAIVKQAVLHHKGKIDCNSTVNQGTSFQISIPKLQ
ncbi:MAG: PAS domain-containing sensor histidine kinase [Leptospiraceae bacterium]|nr:PAS domain-containing sensor histidine kinase [Leptospiraceae bacterium]